MPERVVTTRSLRTERLPTEDRFARWLELTARELWPVRGRSGPGFQGTARILDLGTLQIAGISCSALELSRTVTLIQAADPLAYVLMLVRNGAGEVSYGNRRVGVFSDDLLLLDSSRPHTLRLSADGRPIEVLFVRFPQAWSTVPPTAVERAIVTPLPSQTGPGAVLHGYLVGLLRTAEECAGGDSAPLSSATRHLLEATCVQWARGTQDVEGPPDEILEQIHRFIDDHLDRPGLSPGTIAAAHQMSTRQLHRVFQANGVGVAAWIRRRRLENCRRDLADPRHRSRTIHGIAHRWGFSDGAHFSRLFRATFGMPPSAYRRSALLDEVS